MNDFRSQYQEHVVQFAQKILFQLPCKLIHHHHLQRRQPQLQRLVKRVSIIPRSLKISEGSQKTSSSNFNQLSGSKKILHNSFNVNFKGVNHWKPDIKFQTHPGMSTNSTHQLSKRQTHPGMFTQYFRKLCNKYKTRNIFGQQTKEAHQHISFKPPNQQFWSQL